MTISQEILTYTKILWDYHRINDEIKKSDLIFCLGSVDIRSAHRAAELYLKGFAPKILFSGGIAHANDLLRTTWSEPEAVVFANEAIKLGVPSEDVILEKEASNTGENITKGYQVITHNGIHVNSMILVQKPYMGRRTYATFMKQWPISGTEIMITSPQISFEEYFNVSNEEKEKIINIMVGDLQRIKEYPAKGFQIYQEIPANVMQAYEFLVKSGLTAHLIR